MKNKKKLFGSLYLLLLFTIIGCGSENQLQGVAQVNDLADEEIISEDQEIISEKNSVEVSVNREEKEITYECDENEVSLKKCVANSENLYLLQSADYVEKPSLYVMKIGEDKTEKINIDIPQNLEICNMTVDFNGNLHLLLNTYEEGTDAEKQIWEIWMLDSNYNIVKRLDVSEAFEGKAYRPYGFYIDKSECYYIQGRWDMIPTMVLNNQGILVNQLDSEELGIESVQSVGRGKDGKIYLVYGGDKAGTIGVLDGVAGNIEKQYENVFPEDDTNFFVINAGTDTDLLAYSATSGIWACNLQENTLTHKVDMTEKTIPLNTVILNRLILEDGRLLIVENILEDNGDLKYRNFKYIPGGD